MPCDDREGGCASSRGPRRPACRSSRKNARSRPVRAASSRSTPRGTGSRRRPGEATDFASSDPRTIGTRPGSHICVLTLRDGRVAIVRRNCRPTSGEPIPTRRRGRSKRVSSIFHDNRNNFAALGQLSLRTTSGGVSVGSRNAPAPCSLFDCAGLRRPRRLPSTTGGESGGGLGGDRGGHGGSVGAAGITGGGGTSVAGGGGDTGAGSRLDAGGAAGVTGGATSNAQGPCDIYRDAGQPCVAAYSTVRRLLSTYAGPLYQIRSGSSEQNTGSGGETHDIGQTTDGFADAAAVDAACAGTKSAPPSRCSTTSPEEEAISRWRRKEFRKSVAPTPRWMTSSPARPRNR